MRQLTAQDARAMAAIHAESFASSFGSGGWDALEMAAHTQKDMCFGIERGETLGAFIILSAAAGQAEILTIATAARARRKGLARALLSGAEAALQKRKISELFLEVAEDNAAAIALYRGAGFTPMGRRPAYYRRAQGRVAAISFSKTLSKNSI